MPSPLGPAVSIPDAYPSAWLRTPRIPYGQQRGPTALLPNSHPVFLTTVLTLGGSKQDRQVLGVSPTNQPIKGSGGIGTKRLTLLS